MSRETDRSSSGPQGRGGSYPPGSEPYGPGAAGDSADAESASGAGSDPNAAAKGKPSDRKTETTLTTRIRINIPGSRPIPPVVMRTPVNEDDTGVGTPETGPSTPIHTDDGQTGGAPRPMGANGPSGPAGVPGSPGSPEGASAGGEFKQETSDWFAPRKGKAGPAGPGGAGGQGGAGQAPGAGDPAYGSNDPYGVGSPYGVDDPYGSSDPYDTGSYPFPRTDTPATGTPRSAIHGLLDDTGTPAHGVPSAPGPTTGPASGDMPLPQRPRKGGAPGEAPANPTLGLGAGAPPFAPGGTGQPPAYPQGGPASGEGYGLHGGREGHAVPDRPADDHTAGDTLMGRGPRTPAPGAGPTPASPFQGAGQDAGASTPAGPAADSDEAEPSGGRSILVLAGIGIAGVLGIAYGAGLLLDHADVPNGTTVLGIDIGGTSRHEAVNKLDAAFGDRTTQPFTVVASGQRAQLKPSVAGLTLDTEATVRDAAGRDYNPVSVIGSLFGAERDAEPALKVDGEKMASALTDISRRTGDGGAPKDGSVKFIKGKAVAVPGKPHKGIDPRKAGDALEKAYRNRAATGNNSPVELPVSVQQPRIGEGELKRAIKEFGRPAMSGLVTVKAGNASIQFSPEKSLPKFLSMKPVNGTLVDTYDLPVLQDLYGTTFAGVKITRGDGSKTPVTPQDVAGALRLALKETSPAKRVQEIQLNAR